LLVRIRISRPSSSKPQSNFRPELEAIAIAPPGTVTQPAARASQALGGSSRVAIGILGSRLTGLLRERIIGHYFGLDSIVADSFRQAIRIPNLLNNLFGEGVLSASFVTVYSKLRALKEDDQADDLAAAVFSLLALVCAVLVALGIAAAPVLVYLIAPGFKEEGRLLTIRLVRILFPCTGLLVMSAWCLGVLNSHRKFLLSYLSPVALNVTVIVIAVLAGKSHGEMQLVGIVAWAFVLGAALQFAVQVPPVLKLLPDFQPLFEFKSANIRKVIGNFGPVFVSRGVVQLSAFADSIIASWLPIGAVAAFGYAQVISILPVSLFSMSVSAAELPALSSAVGNQDEVAATLRQRLAAGLRRIAFFIVPSAVAFLFLGDVIAAALYQSGRFNHDNAVYVWGILAGSSVGLLATSLGRLYSSAFYALLDTRTPLRFAVIRVLLTTLLGLLFALGAPKWIGIDPKWGVAGLTASAGVAGWLEFALLRHALAQRIGMVSLTARFTAKLWLVAVLSGSLAYLPKLAVGINHPILLAAIVLPVYGVCYFAGTFLLDIEEAQSALKPFSRR
jgi:putative peptidoglycan lipid II flippase